MRTQSIAKLAGIFLILGLTLTPAFSLAGKPPRSAKLQKMRTQMLVKKLNLSSSQAKAFQAVGEKYARRYREIIGKLRNSQRQLEAQLTASPAEEKKIRETVTSLIAAQDQLLNTHKLQRNEEMALLSPIQQGRYLLTLRHWRRQLARPGKKRPVRPRSGKPD